MRTTVLATAAMVLLLATLFSGVDASHCALDCCVPSGANPEDVNVVDLTGLGGSIFYLEERDEGLGTIPPVPLAGFLTGSGTWLYEETNEIYGLQRGWACMQECILLPLVADADPVFDENCGRGPDAYVAGFNPEEFP